MTPRRGDDRGVATVLVCFLAMALIAVTVLGLQLGAAVAARHHAESAADLAALAGAAVVLDGGDTACSAARRIATANGVVVTSCATDGADVLVEVSVAVRIGPLDRAATAHSRAGPVAAQAP